MTSGLWLAVALLASTLPLAVALGVALQPRSRPRSVDDYFVYGGKLSPSLFLKSSVGYSLQVAAVFLFVAWYASYGIQAAFVPIFWFVGYRLQSFCVRRGLMDRFLSWDDTKVATIHGYVKERFGLTNGAVALISLTTVFGLVGTMVAEVDYTAAFLVESTGFSNVPNASVGVQLVLLVFGGFYVLWGGFRASVHTDAIQVPMAYLSFAGVVAGLLWVAGRRGSNFEASGVAWMCVGFFALFQRNREKLSKFEPSYPIVRDRLFFGALIVLFIFLALALWTLPHSEPHEVALIPSLWREGSDFLGFGVLGALGLAVTNAAWQFIDISSLQRLQAAAGRLDEVVEGSPSLTRRQAVVGGLNAAATESAGSWVLAIGLAIAMSLTGAPAASLSEFFASIVGEIGWLLPLFLFALVTFMLSTMSAMISATAFVAYYDLMPIVSTGTEVSQRQSLGLARVVSLIALASVYGLFLLLKNVLGTGTAPVLYAVYAVQLSAGAVFAYAILLNARLGARWCIAAILAGWIVAITTALTTSPPRLLSWIPTDSWYVLPPLAVILVAVPILLAGWLVGGGEVAR